MAGAGVDATGAAGWDAAAGAAGAGAAVCGAGSERSATTSSPSSKRLDLKPLKSATESPGAETLRQERVSQSFGASMWTLCPPISKEIELPAWADVVAISSAAMTNSFFMRASFRRVGR